MTYWQDRLKLPRTLVATTALLAVSLFAGCYKEPSPPLAVVAFPLETANSTITFSFEVKPGSVSVDRGLMLSLRYPKNGSEAATEALERDETPVRVDLEEQTSEGLRRVEVSDWHHILSSNGHPSTPGTSAVPSLDDANRVAVMSHDASDTRVLIGRFSATPASTYKARITTLVDMPEFKGIPVSAQVSEYLNTGK